MSLRLALPLLGLAIACRSYTPGSLTVAGPGGEVRRVGCLDIAVEPEFDPQSEGPVVRVIFANRCDSAVEVDLASIQAQGRLADGSEVRLRLFDPNHVIRPGLLEARRVGREIIEFQAPNGATTHPAALCLDLARVDSSATPEGPVIACVSLGVGALAEVQP